MSWTKLAETARAWMAADPDPVTRAQAEAWLAAGDESSLREAFGDRLRFGTAGLRGPLGAGPNRMNRLTVQRVSAGLVGWLDTKNDGRPVVVGYDGRRGSRTFAADAAAVVAASGRQVFLYESTVSTPELAHAVTALGCSAGAMVTASHNPPADNGFKVYGSNGAQILPVDDQVIAELAETVAIPVLGESEAVARIRIPPGAVREAWLTCVLAQRVHPNAHSSGLKIVYTAMHGVGKDLLLTLFRRAGWAEPILVLAQAEPDGEFPTVAFPNPEEPGALDLAIETARAHDADLILANDPDADRLAVVVRSGDDWLPLTGNQVGILLADDLLISGPQGANRMVALSLVSTSMLAAVARAHGVKCVETLTGFKWIAAAAIAHDETGGRFVLGFEEALGYSVGSTVRDKDGISAALIFADLAGHARAHGKNVLDLLESAYRSYGLFETGQKSLTLPGMDGAEKIGAAMNRLRANPPVRIGGVEVRVFRDLQRGVSLDIIAGRESPIDMPPSNVLAWELADGTRVLARPSGTEPKIKFYVEVREAVAAHEPLSEARLRAQVRARTTSEAIVRAAGLS